MESDQLRAVQDYLDEEAARPLSDVRFAAGRAMAEVSRSLNAGAENLLRKAIRAIDQGDRARAQALIERVVGLPFDEHEEVHPGFWTAHLMLFNAVTDAVDESDPTDPGWLDAALEVLANAGPDAALSLQSTLGTLAGEWRLEHRQARRARAAAGSADAEALLERRLDRGETSSRQVISEILDVLIAYERGLAAAR